MNASLDHPELPPVANIGWHVRVFAMDKRFVPREQLVNIPCTCAGVAADIAQYQSKPLDEEAHRIAIVRDGPRWVGWYLDGREQFQEFPANEVKRAQNDRAHGQLRLPIAALPDWEATR
jgi:hypothetical protein